jgi:serine/threonine-protein kinase HipA
VTVTTAADVFKAGALAAHLERTPSGVLFTYAPGYVEARGPAIASTLPVTSDRILQRSGAVPAFFAGLLPEGRRLTALRTTLKTSADDELSLLLAVGSDTIGDVQVVPATTTPDPASDSLTITKSFDEVSFAELIGETGIRVTPRLAGVQDKISAAMISIPLGGRGARYILKLNPPENPHIVENEAFFLDLARTNRMPVPTSRIVHDRDGVPGLLVTRFDRVWDGAGFRMLAVEDACQAMGLWPADKYNVTMEDAVAALLTLTSARPVAAQELLRQLTFAWLTGNGDLHAKNMAVLNAPDVGQRISPAYDLPSTLFYGDTTLALTVGGKDTLSATRLTAFAAELRLQPKAVLRTVGHVLRATDGLAERLAAANLPFDRNLTGKVSRQLATRHREIERAVAE